MTFSLHKGRVVTSSQIKHTHSHQDTSLSPHTCAIQWLRHFYSLSQPHHVTASSLRHVITTRAWEGGPKEHRAKQKWPRETHSITYVPGLSTLSGLSRTVAQPPPSFHCCLRPPSHHPSSLTSVSLVPVSHWLRPSTPFWQYGNHTVIIPIRNNLSIIIVH